eukprot:gene16077-22216_t
MLGTGWGETLEGSDPGLEARSWGPCHGGRFRRLESQIMAQMPDTSDSIEHLPPDAVAAVLSKLPLTSLCLASQTCRRLLELSRPLIKSFGVCCSACGCFVLHPSYLSSKFQPSLELSSLGSVLTCHSPEECQVAWGEEHNSMDQALRRSMITTLGFGSWIRRPTSQVRAKQALCKGCHRVLGLWVLGAKSPPEAMRISAFTDKPVEIEFEPHVLLYGSVLELRGPDQEVEEEPLQFSLPHGLNLSQGIWYHCIGARGTAGVVPCANVLFRCWDVLSMQQMLDLGAHSSVWLGAGAGVIFQGGYAALFQCKVLVLGRLEYAAYVGCRCSGRIGWKFVRAIAPDFENRPLVGRFGTVNSSIAEFSGPDQDSGGGGGRGVGGEGEEGLQGFSGWILPES